MKNKEFLKNVATSIFCASIAFIGGYNAGQRDATAEPIDNVYITTNPANTVVKKEGTTFSFDNDSIVSKSVTPVGVKREDGLFQPTQLLIKTAYVGGTEKTDSVEIHLTEKQILMYNGIYRSNAASTWERK